MIFFVYYDFNFVCYDESFVVCLILYFELVMKVWFLKWVIYFIRFFL